MIRDSRSSPTSTTNLYNTGGYTTNSSYLRRISPPGSPAPKKCCFEQHQQQQQQQQQQIPVVNKLIERERFFCCCYTCPSDNTTSVLATFGVCFLVLGYTVLGAFIFMTLEGGLQQDTAVAASKLDPKSTQTTTTRATTSTTTTSSTITTSTTITTLIRSDKSVINNLRTETVDRLWSITENLNILYRENWTRLAAEEVLIFQDALFKLLQQQNQQLNYNSGTVYQQNYKQQQQQQHEQHSQQYTQNVHKWTFSSSFLYSLTLITTIGYGSVSPRTSWGKLVTIIYALIGIPLMLLYLSTTGDLLARSFRRLYGRMCGINTTTLTTTITSTTNQKTKSSSTPLQCPCTNPIRVPVTLCLIIILAYICSGAVLFHRLENWTLLEGSYFCFTSLGTIGFGDLLPGTNQNHQNNNQNMEELSLIACSGYILTGMALVAMCFSLVQDEGAAPTQLPPPPPPTITIKRPPVVKKIPPMLQHNSLPRKNNFQRNTPVRRSTGAEPLIEYFVPRSVSEFDLSLQADDDNQINQFLPLTVRVPRKNFATKQKEKMVTFEDEMATILNNRQQQQQQQQHDLHDVFM